MLKKVVSFVMCAMLISLASAGCTSPKENKETTAKVTISVGDWPNQSRPLWVEQYNNYLKKMNKKYPDIKVVPDEWAYDVNSFVPKAASGQLPTLYETFYTETQKIINAGYCADITDSLSRAGYLDKMNPVIKELVQKNGRVFGIPKDCYVLGLTANVNMFKKAGLVDGNGVPIFPKTYEELAQTASLIKKKTGHAGFILPTMNNFGGWHFMSIAWSFGVIFMEQRGGKWVATFDSPEAVKALQFVKDLKWKYDALPDNALIDNAEMQKLFATDQGAMYFSNPADPQLFETYGMSRDAFAAGPMPAGEKGHYTLTGGKVYMVNPDATQEQIDACLKWLEVTGESPVVDDDLLKALDDSYKTQAKDGYVVGIHKPGVWINKERVEAEAKIIDKYCNINKILVDQFVRSEGVKVRAEEPINCQELYKTLDACIQAVLTDKNADVEKLIKQANSDFQRNYLDKVS